MAITEQCLTGTSNLGTICIQTNLYATATPEGELVRTGLSATFNPNSAK